jgi:hypothetical protein
MKENTSMKTSPMAHYIFIIALAFTFSCTKPFPVNPAGSITRNYNREEIRLLREELDHTWLDTQRISVIKGLLWLLDFVQDDNNFVYIFHNYIPMLYEVSVINNDAVIRNIARRVIRNESLRGAGYAKSIFTKNNEQDIILMTGILERVNAPTDAYVEYFKKILNGYDGEKCRAEFYTAVKSMNYDKLSDSLCDYSHFRFAYKGRMKKSLRLPVDYRDEFLRTCASLPFKYTVADEDGYRDQNYYATHVVFVMTGYGEYPIRDTAFARKLRKYLLQNFPIVRARVHDLDLLGEYVECMKIFGLGQRAEVIEAVQYIISRQDPDGSWAKKRGKDDDPYSLFHPSWTSITAIHYNRDCNDK